MVPCTCSQIKFMHILALSEQMRNSGRGPMGFTLAIPTGDFICFQYKLRKRGHRKGTKQVRPCSITWLTEIYQHTTCWVCDHATCCVFLCFTLQHRITLLFCPTTGASGESKQIEHVFYISHYQIFSGKLIYDDPAQKNAFYFCHKTLSSFFEKLMSALSLNGLLFRSLLGDSKANS